eukprot:4145443-Pleurochrysis_carterae.AAC.1
MQRPSGLAPQWLRVVHALQVGCVRPSIADSPALHAALPSAAHPRARTEARSLACTSVQTLAAALESAEALVRAAPMARELITLARPIAHALLHLHNEYSLPGFAQQRRCAFAAFACAAALHPLATCAAASSTPCWRESSWLCDATAIGRCLREASFSTIL